MLKRLLLLLFLPIAFCGVEAVVLNHYIYPGDNLLVHVDISEDYTGTADLKFCLANFDFDTLSYNYRCDTLLTRFDITFDKNFSYDYTLPLNGIQPLIYRLFVQLHFDDVYHKDSDSNNFIYVASSSEPAVYIYNPKGLAIDARSVPELIEQGTTISVPINITSYENCTKYTIFSYVYDDNNCVTGNFNDNKKIIELPYGSEISITLNNTLNYNATLGNYDYKIKISGCGKDHELSKPVIVAPKNEIQYNLTIENYTIIIKNYEQVNITCAVKLFKDNNETLITNTIPPHSQKIIGLNQSSQFLTIELNNKEILSKLLLNEAQDVIIKESIVYSNQSVITGDLIVKEFEFEEKHFYILCILSSLGALALMYKVLR